MWSLRIKASGSPLIAYMHCTFLPGTHTLHIDFSVRLTGHFPMHAGYVTLSDLCLPLLKRLKTCSRENTLFPHLAGIMKAEALAFHPALPDPQSTDQILHWHPGQSAPSTGMSQEMHAALLVREAEKRAQSGVKPEMIAKQLFRDIWRNISNYARLF
ncbi:AraC family transcriptional regulator [Vibrio sp. PP-XX7]